MEVAKLKASIDRRRTESTVETVVALYVRRRTSSGDIKAASLFIGAAMRLG
jgi:hypothetical protein